MAEQKDKQDVGGRWSLPAPLIVTAELLANPEWLAKYEQQQKEWEARTASPFGNLSVQEFARSRAVIQIRHLQERLFSLDKAISEGKGVHAQRITTASQLAEAYAIVGRFDLAAQVEPHPDKRDDWLSIFEAVLKDDSEECDCSDPKGAIPTTRVFVERDVWDIRKGRVRTLLRCQKCKTRNVTDTPKALAEMRSHRASAVRALSNLDPAEAMLKEQEAGRTLQKLMT